MNNSGWGRLGKDAPRDSGLPFVNFKDGEVVRVRLIAGPGKYAEPQQRWQHWAPSDAKVAGAVSCAGLRQGCIFHEGPLAWRSNGPFYMNAIQYTTDKDTKAVTRTILVMRMNRTIGDAIKDQSFNMLGIDPAEVDWLIKRSGSKKEDTRYEVTRAQNVMDPGPIDLSLFPVQEAYADKNVPQLIDYDLFDGVRPMTALEQRAWFQANVLGEEQEALPGAPAQTALGAPAPALSSPEKNVTPRPAPQIGLSTSPPPAPPPTEHYAALPDPWQMGTSMGELPTPKLEWIVQQGTNAGFQQKHVDAATSILQDRGVIPRGVPFSTFSGIEALSNDELQAKIRKYVGDSPILSGVGETRKFFTYAGGSALRTLPREGLLKLVALIDQGDDAVRAVVHAA